MNRSKEIRALSEGCEWRHVPGEINPADLPSRGSTMKKLLQCRWWEGHTWLYEDPEHWPQHEEQLHEHEVNAEKRKTVVSAISLQSNPAPGKWYAYFSRFTKLVRMIGWMQRFISNLKYKKIHGCLPTASDLTASKISNAEEKAILFTQCEAFTGTNDSGLNTLR